MTLLHNFFFTHIISPNKAVGVPKDDLTQLNNTISLIPVLW